MLPQTLSDTLTATVSVVVLLNYCACTSEDDLSRIQGKPLGVGLPQLQADEIEGFPTSELFFTTYAIPHQPLIMRGAAKVSPAFHKWSDAYFMSLSIPENSTVEVEDGKKENRSGLMADINFHKFLQIYNTSDIYMVQDVPMYLRSDLVVPCHLRCPEMRLLATVMWFSSGGTVSVLHNDNVDNINCLYRGRKEMIFIDYKYHHLYNLDRRDGTYSGVDVDAVDYVKYPGLAQVEYYNLSLTAGDCVFIPHLWAHQVRSYGSNLAVNLWWDYKVNQRINLSRCDGKCEVPVSYDQVEFRGLGSHSLASDVRYRIKALIGAIESLSCDDIALALVNDPILSDIVSPTDRPMYADIVRTALKPIDVNDDSFLTVSEVDSAVDESWDEMLQLVKRLDSLHEDDGNNDWSSFDEDEGDVSLNEPDDLVKDEL